MPAATIPLIRRNPAISRAGFLALSFLMLSFAYEWPLVNLTGSDRLNPRLFDLAAIVFIIYWFFTGRVKGWRISTRHPIVRLWVWITVFFGIATMASVFWIPMDVYVYSLFYFYRYLICLFVVLIFAAIPFDDNTKRRLCWVIMLGGAFTSTVAVLQFFGFVAKQRYLPGGEEIVLNVHGILSTLGVTYWHLGMYSLLCFVLAVALFFAEKSVFRKIVLLILAAMFTFSIVVCGSRAAIAALALVMVLLTFRTGFRNIIFGVIFSLLAFGVGQYFYEQSGTKVRIEADTENTAQNRLWTGPLTLAMVYDYHGPRLLATGGGFYVVPLERDGKLKYRKGYGNHNIFLFPLEQAGLIPFVLALIMWYRLISLLRRFSTDRKFPNFSRGLSRSIYIYLIAMLLVGIAGQVFWFGFGTENFTAFQVMMFIFASSPPRDTTKNIPNIKRSKHANIS